MLIHEMTEAQCRSLLERVDVGRLACSLDNQPYIVPIHFSYDGIHLYGITTLGQKVRWMRSNPRVCVEVEEHFGRSSWLSAVVFGKYQELPDTAMYQPARARALAVLENRTMWWEPACVSADGHESRSPVYYRIAIESITGRHGSPEPPASVP